MVSYAENDLRALQKKVLRSWINPDDEYDPVKHGDFQYIHTVYERFWRLSLALGESRARLQALKKKDRNLDKRKEMGRRNDGTICERNGRCKFRLVEAAKKFEENSTKWLKESFKTPKIMHDMLVQLMSVVKNDDRAKKLQTVGWLHFGLYAQTLEMDCANGYVCRLIRWELRKVGKGLGPGWDC
ncbi:unnamed protein product [Rhizophagus irregularis]|nr:unnamed protein product [Rhizophagus irregularis]